MSDPRKMRVLRVIARLNIGGPAIQAVALTRRLFPHGVETRLVCGRVGPHEGDMSYIAESQGVKPDYLEALGRDILPFADVRSLLSLAAMVRSFRPHLIHTHTAKAGTLGRLAGILHNLVHPKGKRIRLVHTFHGHVFHSYFGRFKTALFLQIERFLARFTDRIIVISPAQKNDICDRYRIAPRRKVSVVPLGFDFSAFTGRRGEKGLAARRTFAGDGPKEGRFVVGFVGRLVPVKNPHMLLGAAYRLAQQGLLPSFRFVIVGDGEMRGELEQRVRALGLSDAVLFAGWQKEMEPIYEALDAVALTSLNEGTPVSLIEAMAAARPIVSTSVGGVPDLLGRIQEEAKAGVMKAERGLLVSSGDEEALARALVYLRDRHPGEGGDMEKRARRYALSAYGLERLVMDVKCLYRGLLLEDRRALQEGRRP